MEEKYQQINIGTQNINNGTINYFFGVTPTTTTTAQDVSAEDGPSDSSNKKDLFKYIHVDVTDDKERADVHKKVCNIVRLPKMQLVCDELCNLMKNRQVLCSINPEAMLTELRRLGLPSAETSGFSDKNLYYYYKAPKVD